MKKYIARILLIPLAGLTFLSACKKAQGIGPSETPYKVFANVSFPKTSYGNVTNLNIKASVSTYGADYAYIVLSVKKYGAHTGQIFIKHQVDNGVSKRLNDIYPTSNDSSKYVFAKGDTTNQTYSVPVEIDTAFNLTIPVRLRKTGEPIADTYTIWITKRGEPGDFNDPTKGLAYGIAVITFNYTSEGLINQYSTTLGNSVSNNTLPSCLASVTDTKYLLATAKDSVLGSQIAPHIDFIYNNTKAGKFVFGSVKKSTAVFDFDTVVTNGLTGTAKDLNRLSSITAIAEYTAGDFDNIKSFKSLINAVDFLLPTPLVNYQTHITYTGDPKGKVFAFKTASGYRGLARIGTLTGDATSTGTVILDLKVQR